jgi:hypothetical protein
MVNVAVLVTRELTFATLVLNALSVIDTFTSVCLHVRRNGNVIIRWHLLELNVAVAVFLAIKIVAVDLHVFS